MTATMRAVLVLGVGLGLIRASEAQALAAERLRVVKMQVGEDKGMRFKGMTRVTIHDPRVADVKPVASDAFLLYATGAGKTRLEVERSRGPGLVFEIIVSEGPPAPEPAAKAGPADIRLRVGERKVMSAAGYRCLSIEDPRVITIEPNEDETFSLLATGPGRSFLALDGGEQPERVYQVEVTATARPKAPRPASTDRKEAP